jgi:hypothetical protein
MTIYLITGILFYTSTRVNVIRDQACGNIAEKIQERLLMSHIIISETVCEYYGEVYIDKKSCKIYAIL